MYNYPELRAYEIMDGWVPKHNNFYCVACKLEFHDEVDVHDYLGMSTPPFEYEIICIYCEEDK